MVKRAIDIVISSLGLIILAPLFLVVAILIKRDSPGPVFFRQIRIGRDEKPFLICKFRTMVENAPRLGPELTQKDDPRITRVGRILRRTSIDELPQLINVLKGEMSLIGPRPEIPSIVRNYTPKQKKVLKVKPGMTGLSQVNGRDTLSLSKKLRIDLEYVKKQSILLDVYILFKTLSVIFSSKGVN